MSATAVIAVIGCVRRSGHGRLDVRHLRVMIGHDAAS
jgi:hypothetical protein